MSWLSKAFKMVQKNNFIALYYSSGHKNTSDATCMGKKKIVKCNHERVITIEEYRKAREKVEWFLKVFSDLAGEWLLQAATAMG